MSILVLQTPLCISCGLLLRDNGMRKIIIDLAIRVAANENVFRTSINHHYPHTWHEAACQHLRVTYPQLSETLLLLEEYKFNAIMTTIKMLIEHLRSECH